MSLFIFVIFDDARAHPHAYKMILILIQIATSIYASILTLCNHMSNLHSQFNLKFTTDLTFRISTRKNLFRSFSRDFVFFVVSFIFCGLCLFVYFSSLTAYTGFAYQIKLDVF